LFQGISISTTAGKTSKALIFVERHAQACVLVLVLGIHLADLAAGWGRVKIDQGGVSSKFKDTHYAIQRFQVIDDSVEEGHGWHGRQSESEDGLRKVHCDWVICDGKLGTRIGMLWTRLEIGRAGDPKSLRGRDND
jgi:hypothetical protein